MIDSRTPDLVHNNLFRGRGTVSVWNCVPQKRVYPFSVVLWCSLSAQGIVGRHKQQAHHQVIVCISGKGEIRIQKRAIPFEKGASIAVAKGDVLSIHNLEETELIYTITKVHAE